MYRGKNINNDFVLRFDHRASHLFTMAYSTRMTYTNTPFVPPTLILIITAYATLSESSIWKQCQHPSPYAIIHIKTYKYAHPIEINHTSILLSLTVLFVLFPIFIIVHISFFTVNSHPTYFDHHEQPRQYTRKP